VTSAPTVLATLSLGASLGVLHAFDADHLVALTTMAADDGSPRRTFALGVVWGIGHAAALAAVGILVVGLRWTIPVGVAFWLEMAVAAMLVGLGAVALARGLGAGRPVLHAHVHAHGGTVHAHRHVHAHRDERTHAHGIAGHDGILHALAHAGRRPLAVGMVHGLAGSAALTLVVLSSIPSPLVALAYIVVFGLGSIAGMGAASALLALPLGLASLAVARDRLRVVVGAGGMAFGVVLAFRLLAEQRLLGG
jgi:ABC-type nickel/cobalt efflux system permease component RcnA